MRELEATKNWHVVPRRNHFSSQETEIYEERMYEFAITE